MNNRNLTTTGIILRQQKVGEDDILVDLLTPGSLGIVKFAARGGRKIKSRFKGNLEAGNYLEVALYNSGRRFTLTQSKVLHSFSQAKNDLSKLMILFNNLEITSLLVQENHLIPNLFPLLLETLTMLNKTTNKEKASLLGESYKIKLLTMGGYLHDFHYCTSCARKFTPPTIFFDATKLVMLCPECAHHQEEQVEFDLQKILAYLQKESYNEIKKLHCPTYFLHKVREIIELFLEQQIATPLKSSPLINLVS